jgi:hypothetical protein
MNKPDWEFDIMEASCTYSFKDRNEMITVKRMDEGAGAFFFIETEGCAFNDIDELVELMKDAAKRMGMEE